MDERKNRYRKKLTGNSERIAFTLDTKALNLICSFVVSENLNIKKSHLLQLRKLVNQIDIDKSYKDQERIDRMRFIIRGLEAKLDYGYSDQYIVLKHINGGLVSSPLIPMESIRELNNAEVGWINNMVSEALKTSFMENETDDLYNLLAEYKSSNVLFIAVKRRVLSTLNKSSLLFIDSCTILTSSGKLGKSLTYATIVS